MLRVRSLRWPRGVDTICILVWAERPYIQCSLLLVLPRAGVLVVGGYKLGRERDHSQVSVSGCVRVFECVSSMVPFLGVV
jgi:hypothetical protein